MDQNCIAFHAIKPGCEKWRRVNNNPPIEPKDDDFKLCKRNSSLKHEIDDILQYNVQFCYHDAYVKANEPGTLLYLIIRKSVSNFPFGNFSAFFLSIVSVCIDQIPTDEFESCHLCKWKHWKHGPLEQWCNANWTTWWHGRPHRYVNPQGACRGYDTDRQRKEICKATCGNCGKYFLIAPGMIGQYKKIDFQIILI